MFPRLWAFPPTSRKEGKKWFRRRQQSGLDGPLTGADERQREPRNEAVSALLKSALYVQVLFASAWPESAAVVRSLMTTFHNSQVGRERERERESAVPLSKSALKCGRPKAGVFSQVETFIVFPLHCVGGLLPISRIPFAFLLT